MSVVSVVSVSSVVPVSSMRMMALHFDTQQHTDFTVMVGTTVHSTLRVQTSI